MEPLDTELVKKVKINECSESLLTLANKHLPLCVKVYNRYLPALSSMGISMEEIQEDRLKTVWGAAISFKESKKTKFSSWLANHIRYQCLKKLTKKGKEPHCVEIDKVQVSDKVIAFKENLNYVFDILEKMSDKRIKQIFEMKYSEKELNFSQIAEILDLSPFRVSQLHQMGLEKLRKKIKKGVDFQKKEE